MAGRYKSKKIGSASSKRLREVSEETLWKNFSLYIRLRDSDANGYGKCISCGKIVHYKEADCGHFKSRRYQTTKYNEKNNNLQCTYCNDHLKGNEYAYSLALDEKFGEGTAETLHNLSQMTGKKLKPYEITILNDEIKEKIKKLKEVRNEN